MARAADLQPGQEYRAPVYESMITNAVRRPSPRPMVFSVDGPESLTTPAGVFATRRIVVRSAGESGPVETLTYWVESAPRRALVKFASTDGRSLLLTAIARRDYWSRN